MRRLQGAARERKAEAERAGAAAKALRAEAGELRRLRPRGPCTRDTLTRIAAGTVR